MKFFKKEKETSPIFVIKSDGEKWHWESTFDKMELISILSTCITDIVEEVRRNDDS